MESLFINQLAVFYFKKCSEIKYMNCVESSKAVEILDFSGACSLVKIEGKFFECLENLQVLNLSGTKTLLKELPALTNLKSLKHLFLRGCGQLEALPLLELLHNLETLDLSQQH
ncbi:unnamed protein product [Coffea canephora]|uniref:DH200=94 genomic scaffold, scaffold_177 n=1 Tax=Coffea canephora TaxID=49390 RepID=A0A068VAJ1_COFCA|nr:unnamed protein product [Coffea canephora]